MPNIHVCLYILCIHHISYLVLIHYSTCLGYFDLENVDTLLHVRLFWNPSPQKHDVHCTKSSSPAKLGLISIISEKLSGDCCSMAHARHAEHDADQYIGPGEVSNRS